MILEREYEMRENALKNIYKTIDNGTAAEKMANLPVFPKIIEFEITNHCNFNCIMCPTGIGTARRERGYMSDETYYKVLDEISEHKVALKFVGQGESLLHPKAIEYIVEAKRRGIITHLTTNGSLLTEDMMRKLVDTQALDSIKFSFQGIDAEGYEILRQKDGFNDLMKKIKLLFDIRGEKEKPYITIGTSITNEKKEAIESFIEKAQTVCDKVEVGMTNLETSELSLVKSEKNKEKLSELRSQQMVDKKRYVCCPQVYDTITVRWNGDITACCGDIHGLLNLGNIHSCSILECWNGEKESTYRKVLAEGRYDDIEACKNCYDVYGWTYGDN